MISKPRFLIQPGKVMASSLGTFGTDFALLSSLVVGRSLSRSDTTGDQSSMRVGAIAPKELAEALQAAQAGWSGCDWETEFGTTRVNLRGLRSHQARLAAQATRGAEASCWQEACRYLETVERDASRAAELARCCIEKWMLGDIEAARRLLDEAIALEARYRRPITYPNLKSALGIKTPPSTQAGP